MALIDSISVYFWRLPKNGRKWREKRRGVWSLRQAISLRIKEIIMNIFFQTDIK